MAGNHSPRHSSDYFESRRATRLTVSSPWNQIVRGESETIPAAPSSVAEVTAAAAPSLDDSAVENSDNGCGNNGGGAVKRHAWNKPSSNGGAPEASPVMGAGVWPALSESTKATVKSESSLKGLLDGSPLPQSQVPVSKPASSSQRQVSDNASTNNMVPTRQKSFRHNNSNESSNGGHPQHSAPQVSVAATGSPNYSPKDHHSQRSGFVSNDHPQQRNSFRNRNTGPHQRGDGAHHHNYGNRRDQDWNSHRNFNGRDTHIPPRVVPRFMRPPPPFNSAQFIHTPPVRPFGGHLGFHEIPPPMVYVGGPPPPPPPPPDSLRGVPTFVSPMPHPALYFTTPDPQLHSKIVNQINYYFSNENLIKDTFLRQNMDDQGWVSIKLIAGFKKVMLLTDNIQLILDAVRTSLVVEVQGDKIRRRNDWRGWIIPPSLQFPGFTGSQALGMLADQVQSIALETTKGLDALPNASQPKPSFGDLHSPLQLSSSDDTNGQVGIQASDHSISARN